MAEFIGLADGEKSAESLNESDYLPVRRVVINVFFGDPTEPSGGPILGHTARVCSRKSKKVEEEEVKACAPPRLPRQRQIQDHRSGNSRLNN